MQLQRLSGRKTADFVLRRGKIFRGKYAVIHWMPGPPRNAVRDMAGIFVGTFASAKLHKSAVVRNRMRRRLREALRITVKDQENLPSAQLLMTPRAASLNAPFPELCREIRAFLSTLPPWPT